jgi:hypothetical protein
MRRFVLNMFLRTSRTASGRVRGGYPQGIVDGYIFYLNPQRFASNELWDLIQEQHEPIIAMHWFPAVGSQATRRAGAAWKEYLQIAVESADLRAVGDFKPDGILRVSPTASAGAATC